MTNKHILVIIIGFFFCVSSNYAQNERSLMQSMEYLIESQVEQGIGQRFNNLDEAARAFENAERLRQEQGQYEKVQCPSCNGYGRYYNNDGKIMTCPTCAGIGYVHRYSASHSSSNSNSIYGEWVEYRADDPSDTYLISHLEFKNNGLGAFWLTDEGEIRTKFEFMWNFDGNGNIIAESWLSDKPSIYSFHNGLIISHSAMGEIVYKKAIR